MAQATSTAVEKARIVLTAESIAVGELFQSNGRFPGIGLAARCLFGQSRDLRSSFLQVVRLAIFVDQEVGLECSSKPPLARRTPLAALLGSSVQIAHLNLGGMRIERRDAAGTSRRQKSGSGRGRQLPITNPARRVSGCSSDRFTGTVVESSKSNRMRPLSANATSARGSISDLVQCVRHHLRPCRSARKWPATHCPAVACRSRGCGDGFPVWSKSGSAHSLRRRARSGRFR